MKLDVIAEEVAQACTSSFDFYSYLHQHGLDLSPIGVDTLQVNITKLCNQVCKHCHVDASPKRTEQMDLKTVERCLEILAEYPQIKNLDLTGGAPELNPHFDYFVLEARQLEKNVMVRHNLTVTFDGCPKTGESKEYIPEFFAEQRVEVISSLPYYQEFFTDKQRGRGVFEKSIDSLKLLNQLGYGQDGTGLELNLVYNPIGPYLPPEQGVLEEKYKQELSSRYGIVFNSLFAIANMPIHRFRKQLQRLGQYEDYMSRLGEAFNPLAAEAVMCRSLISVSHEGRLYDCDFNQMLQMGLQSSVPQDVFSFDLDRILARKINFAPHCLGCTAGSGSGCGGASV